MNITEETLVTPIFDGSMDENTHALGVWQQWLYVTQAFTDVSPQNRTPLLNGIHAHLSQIMNAGHPEAAIVNVAPPQVAAFSTPFVQQPADSDSEGGDTDVTFDFTTEQVSFERRMLELAGVRIKGVE